MKKTILTILMCAFSCGIFAQISNSVYFDKLNYRQHHLNPSFQPIGKFYVGVPFLSSISVGGGNTDLTLTDIFRKVKVNGKEETVLFCDKNAGSGVDDFMDALHGREQFFASLRMDYVDAGYRINDKFYVSFNVSKCFDANIVIPEKIFEFLFKGMENGENFDFEIDKMDLSATLYTEYAGGFSAKFDDKLTIGAKAKFLVGNGNISSNFRNLDIEANEKQWKITGSASIKSSIYKMKYITDEDDGKIDDVKFDDDEKYNDELTNGLGHGFAIDAGANYQITPELNVSASVLDLGFISWSNNIQEVDTREDFVYEGVPFEISKDNAASGWWDPYKQQFQNMLKVNENPEKYTNWLCAKLFVGGEYTFLDGLLSAGLLSKTYIKRKSAREELIIAGGVRPNSHFSGTFNYSFFNGWNNIGLGLNCNAGPINIFAAMDHIPLRYAKMSGAKVPCYLRDTKVTFGLGVVIGYNKEDKNNY